MRKQYLDNIRWITVILVVVYHVIYMYNGVEVYGVIGPFQKIQYQDVYMYIVYPWFMLLLFVVSGICSRYALEASTERDFIKKRTRRLLVPSTIGLFVFYWILGYYNTAIAGAFEQFPDSVPCVIKYLILVASGIGPLWYIQMLWVFSMLLILVRRMEKDRLYTICKHTTEWQLMLGAFAVWGASQLLNTPIITVYRFGIYGLGFFAGYFVFSHNEVIERLKRMVTPLVAASFLLGTLFVIIFWGMPYAENVVLKTALCNFYAWFSVLAVFAFMKKYGDFDNKLTVFMKNQSWGLYLFHYLPLAAVSYYLNNYDVTLPIIGYYLITALFSFAGAFALNAIIQRIPVLRWCVMGMTKQEWSSKKC